MSPETRVLRPSFPDNENIREHYANHHSELNERGTWVIGCATCGYVYGKISVLFDAAHPNEILRVSRDEREPGWPNP